MKQGGGAENAHPHTEVAAEDSCSRVHFSAQQTNAEHELEIAIKDAGDGLQEVHLGFLKLHHHYCIEFTIKDNLGKDITADPLQNLHCRVMACPPTEDGQGHNIAINFHAYKDKLVNELLVLKSADNSQCLTLKLMARVLGKHKGTPMLKNKIKCIGVDVDEESEQSDWAGFN